MIRMKVIQIEPKLAASDLPINEERKKEEIAKVEEFIAQIGYENIKNIITASPDSNFFSYYSIFYEDNQPYTPYVKPPKK